MSERVEQSLIMDPELMEPSSEPSQEIADGSGETSSDVNGRGEGGGVGSRC